MALVRSLSLPEHMVDMTLIIVGSATFTRLDGSDYAQTIKNQVNCP
jgi:hypothetical protein